MRTCRKFTFHSYVIFIFLFFYNSGKIKAQDTLIMNDGSEMHVKVVEIGDNSISYKKNENPSGPTYTANLSAIFMAIYKNGKRETFEKSAIVGTPVADIKENKPGENVRSFMQLSNSNFEVRLIEVKPVPDKKKKSISVSATVDVFSKGKFFSKLLLFLYQRTDVSLDYTNPNGSYWNKSYISFSLQSPTLSNTLYEKFENYGGKGYGWVLPPDFLSINPSSCSVALLRQKTGNKEVLGFGGISATKFSLTDCSSVEKKLLSVALIWLEMNFLKT